MLSLWHYGNVAVILILVLMSLIVCKECGKEVSDTASSCPHCGAPVVKDVFCTSCGTKFSGNSEYCPNCGTRANAPAKVDLGGKYRLTAGLLALFLGGLGIHYFYIGKTTAGILTIVITLCSCSIWGWIMFVQAILILTMSDADFADRYVNTDKTFPLF